MATVYFRTFVRNSEKTIARTIESVLSQTYQNFVYYILDNGSVDQTAEIIRQYASRDSRIRPFYGKSNNDYTQNLEFWNLNRNIPQEDYFCCLDGDDYYAPSFLEEMLEFMQGNHLDVAACGSTFFDAETGEKQESRLLPCNLITETAQDWENNFPFIFWNIRQMWGKLYSSQTAARMQSIIPADWPSSYGNDTLNVMESLKACKRFGVYGKVLHFYQMCTHSVSFRWSDDRMRSDVLLYEKEKEFIQTKAGQVSPGNQYFIEYVYLVALEQSINVLFYAKIDGKKKQELYVEALTRDLTRSVFWGDFPRGSEVRQECLTAVFFDCISEPWTEENFRQVMHAMVPMFENLITQDNLLIFFNDAVVIKLADGDTSGLVEQMLSDLPQLDVGMQGKCLEILKKFCASDSILNDISDMSFILFYPEIFLALAKKKYKEAFRNMKELIKDHKFTEASESFLKMYLNVAAVLEQAEAYAHGCTLLASFYLENQNQEECDKYIAALHEMGL